MGEELAEAYFNSIQEIISIKVHQGQRNLENRRKSLEDAHWSRIIEELKSSFKVDYYSALEKLAKQKNANRLSPILNS